MKVVINFNFENSACYYNKRLLAEFHIFTSSLRSTYLGTIFNSIEKAPESWTYTQRKREYNEHFQTYKQYMKVFYENRSLAIARDHLTIKVLKLIHNSKLKCSV